MTTPDEAVNLDAAVERVRRWAEYPHNHRDAVAVNSALVVITCGDLQDVLSALSASNARAVAAEEALHSIDVWLSDTLSGRVREDPETYKDWLKDGIREARNRARSARTTLASVKEKG